MPRSRFCASSFRQRKRNWLLATFAHGRAKRSTRTRHLPDADGLFSRRLKTRLESQIPIVLPRARAEFTKNQIPQKNLDEAFRFAETSRVPSNSSSIPSERSVAFRAWNMVQRPVADQLMLNATCRCRNTFPRTSALLLDDDMRRPRNSPLTLISGISRPK